MDFDKKTEKDIGMFRTFLYGIYPSFTRKTVRRHKICVLLRSFGALYLAQILCLLTLESSNGENFFIFKADEEGVPGSTLIEDNAENEEIIPF